MGVLYDYFAAPDDDAAAAVIDRVSGWAGNDSSSRGRRGLFRRRRAEVVSAAPVRPTLSDTGIDPVVQGGTLEELMTGRPYEDVETDPRWGHVVAVRDEGERLVLTVTDGLVAALARSAPDHLWSVAQSWATTEEFRGAGDPQALAGFLTQLADLARDALGRGDTLYCRVSA